MNYIKFRDISTQSYCKLRDQAFKDFNVPLLSK